MSGRLGRGASSSAAGVMSARRRPSRSAPARSGGGYVQEAMIRGGVILRCALAQRICRSVWVAGRAATRPRPRQALPAGLGITGGWLVQHDRSVEFALCCRGSTNSLWLCAPGRRRVSLCSRSWRPGHLLSKVAVSPSRRLCARPSLRAEGPELGRAHDSSDPVTRPTSSPAMHGRPASTWIRGAACIWRSASSQACWRSHPTRPWLRCVRMPSPTTCCCPTWRSRFSETHRAIRAQPVTAASWSAPTCTRPAAAASSLSCRSTQMRPASTS